MKRGLFKLAQLGDGARASTRFNGRSRMARKCPAHLKVVRWSSVNTALRHRLNRGCVTPGPDEVQKFNK